MNRVHMKPRRAGSLGDVIWKSASDKGLETQGLSTHWPAPATCDLRSPSLPALSAEEAGL